MESVDEFGLRNPQRDLDGLPDSIWKQKATDWIYTLRDRTHGLNNTIQTLVGEVSALRGDVDQAVRALENLGSDMKDAKNATVKIESVVGFLKWALPVSVAFSGVLVGIFTVATRK